MCSIIKLIDSLLTHAHACGASDIHIHPRRDIISVRFRVDGSLLVAHQIPNATHAEVISRLKVLAGLRTDEHQIAQDGRFRFALPNDTWLDVRISIAPTYHGENAVLRLLSGELCSRNLSDLGFSPSDQSMLTRSVNKQNGMVLITGPAGSGKTTTLYALLTILAKKSLSIVTIEDPIEYSIEGVTQIQTNKRSGLTFAEGLRSILRQDPDIIMVGEIRDHETASLAVNAALTGHMVLSTLHTRSAIGSIPRLFDLKVDPYLLASTLSLVVGQRLARKICSACKKKDVTSTELFEESEYSTKNQGEKKAFYKGAGCSVCNNGAYRGRIGIYELLAIDEDMREGIGRKLSTNELRVRAEKKGMVGIDSQALTKAHGGIISLEELLRIRQE